LVVITSLT